MLPLQQTDAIAALTAGKNHKASDCDNNREREQGSVEHMIRDPVRDVLCVAHLRRFSIVARHPGLSGDGLGKVVMVTTEIRCQGCLWLCDVALIPSCDVKDVSRPY